MYELKVERRVEFADTDMAGIVHFSRFFDFMEAAEHELLRRLGINVHFEHEGEQIGWPRAETSCRFSSPARLGDVLEIHVRVARKGTKSLTYDFTFSCGERKVAEGRITCICCAIHAKNGLRSIAIPAFLADQIEEAPEANIAGGLGGEDP